MADHHVQSINLINHLHTLCGLSVVKDRGEKGSKIFKIGVLTFLLHLGLRIYSKQKLQEEQGVGLFANNILFAMTTLQGICTLYNPIVYCIGGYLQFPSMDRFLKLQDEMDFYLTTFAEDVLGMQRKMRRIQIMASSFALTVSLISCVSAVYSFCTTFSKGLADVELYTYYTGLFFSLTIVVLVLKVCVYFYSASLQFELFNETLIKINKADRKRRLADMRRDC